MKPILSAALFALLVLVAWRHALPDGLLFFQGIAAAAAGGVTLYATARRAPRAARAKDALFVFLLVYSFVFTIPTTVDRSYSVRMLNGIGASPAGMPREELARMVVKDFEARGGLDRRIDEQSRIGTIAEVDGRWRLTDGGRLLTKAFAMTCEIFVCQTP